MTGDRDRDPTGRPRQARARDALGRRCRTAPSASNRSRRSRCPPSETLEVARSLVDQGKAVLRPRGPRGSVEGRPGRGERPVAGPRPDLCRSHACRPRQRRGGGPVARAGCRSARAVRRRRGSDVRPRPGCGGHLRAGARGRSSWGRTLGCCVAVPRRRHRGRLWRVTSRRTAILRRGREVGAERLPSPVGRGTGVQQPQARRGHRVPRDVAVPEDEHVEPGNCAPHRASRPFAGPVSCTTPKRMPSRSTRATRGGAPARHRGRCSPTPPRAGRLAPPSRRGGRHRPSPPRGGRHPPSRPPATPGPGGPGPASARGCPP